MWLMDKLRDMLTQPADMSWMQQYESAASGLASWDKKPRWPDKDPNVYDHDSYRKISIIFRCVNLISSAAATAPIRVYDESKKEDSLPEHPMRMLMRQPNSYMGGTLFWSNVAMRMAITGFCVVEKERNAFGDVVALHPLRSTWLKAVPRSGYRYDWEYHIPGLKTPTLLKSEDVIPFRWADTPDGNPYGIGPISVAIKDSHLIDKLTTFVGIILERGGVPMWAIVPDLPPGKKLSQAEIDATIESFVQRHGGIEKAAIPIIAKGIKQIERIGLDMNELAYLDLRDVSELSIIQAFGVPARKSLIHAGLEHVTQNATAIVEDGEFYRDTIVPFWARCDDALTTNLMPDFEPVGSSISLEFDTSDIWALQVFREDRAKWLVDGFRAGGFSQHLIHRELGLPVPKTPDFYIRNKNWGAIPDTDPINQIVDGAATAELARNIDNALGGQLDSLPALTNGRHDPEDG